jgi:hypothetical protein
MMDSFHPHSITVCLLGNLYFIISLWKITSVFTEMHVIKCTITYWSQWVNCNGADKWLDVQNNKLKIKDFCLSFLLKWNITFSYIKLTLNRHTLRIILSNTVNFTYSEYCYSELPVIRNNLLRPEFCPSLFNINIYG